MSNALAIATVTETIVQVLGDNLGSSHVVGAQVTALPPDTANGLPNPGVNVFLYQIAPNPSLRNADLPTRTPNGSLLRRPQTALDLYYLFTFYGDQAALEPQRLLGAVALTLHANPVLPRSAIQHVQDTVSFLKFSNLVDQSELVRLTPVNFSLEELSKLWSFLLKIDYVLSVAYQASVVLIETDDTVPGPALPVLAANIVSVPFNQPVIQSAAPTSGTLILPGSQVVLQGRNFVLRQSVAGGLVTATTLVMIGTTPLTPLAVTPTSITLALPPGLPAGTQAMQVVQSLLLGTPPVPHQQGFHSGVFPFVLHPVIQQTAPGLFAILVQLGLASPPGKAVIAKVSPDAQPGQRVLLELLPRTAPTTSNLFDGGTIQAATDTLTFHVPGIAAGDYLVRVRVDGAESPFLLDAGGHPVGPVITL